MLLKFLFPLLLSISPIQDTQYWTAPSDEPVFLEVCWRGTEALQKPIYSVESTRVCSREEVVWDILPIRVKISDNLPYYHQLATRRAMVWWNYVIGREVFLETKYMWHVIVEPSLDCENEYRASARHVREYGTLGGVIDVCSILTSSAGGENTYRHELGHILGLDHDPEHPDSLMYPYYSDGRQLTTNDREALIKRYGP